MSTLALLGGTKAVPGGDDELFAWPILNQAMEDAVLAVLRDRNMSGTDITKRFERGFADWHGMTHALGFPNGTAALHSALYGVGVGVGDEVIAPAITYWATCTQALSLGASVVFADIHPETLCIDPADVARRITPRTKAIVVVHYLGMPADMDAIMALARRHGIKVVEDVSHAHGGLYKGRMTGTFGDAAGYSLMTGKAFAVGEGGMLVTNDRAVYERAQVLGHYERHGELTLPALASGAGLPWGGIKNRMHQMSSAIGLEQLRKFPAEMAEIDAAMNHFWDLLQGVPGIGEHRPPRDSGSTMGAWYAAHAHYRPEELGGLSVKRFCDALEAEGTKVMPGCNRALHPHPLFSTVDIYGHGRPTQGAFLPPGIDQAQAQACLPVAAGIQERVLFIPRFVHFRKEAIARHARAFIKVVERHRDLLPGDEKTPVDGGWALTARKG